VATLALLEEALAAGERYRSGQVDDGPSIPDECLPTHCSSNLHLLAYGSLRCRGLAKLIHTPLIAAIAARLVRAESIRLWRDELLTKQPGGGEATTVGWRSRLLVDLHLPQDGERMDTPYRCGFRDGSARGHRGEQSVVILSGTGKRFLRPRPDIQAS
jgi:hypothetical protein